MNRLRSLLFFFVLFLVFSVPLSADIEIVVTASRLPEDPDTVTSAVYTITEDDIARSGAATPADVLDLVPFVNVRSVSGSEQAVSFGGFGENAFGRVLVLIDGIPVNRPDMRAPSLAGIPLDSIRRIEVLRGPAASQYGDAAVAGVVNIITKKGTKTGFTVSLSGDQFFSNREALTLTLSETNISSRLDFSRESDRYSRKRSASDLLSVAGSLAWSPLSWLTGEVHGGYGPVTRLMPGGLTREQFEADPDSAVNTSDEERGVSWNAGATLAAEPGDWKFSIPATWTVTDAESDTASLFSYFNSAITDLSVRPQAAYSLYFSDSLYTVMSGGTDLRFISLGIDRFPDSARSSASFSAKLSRNSAGFWIRDKFSWNDLIIIDGGFRYELAGVTASSKSDPRLDGTVSQVPISFDAGLLFHPFDGFGIGARYGRVFRYPFLEEQASYYGFGTDALFSDIEPETGHHYAASLEYKAAELSFSLFSSLILMEREIVYDASRFRNVNSGATLHLGVSPTLGWQNRTAGVSAGYSYELAQFSDGANVGKRIPLVPEHQVKVRAHVALPAGLVVSTDFRYWAAFYHGGDDANALDMVPGRVSWDAAVGWKAPFLTGLEMKAAARNLLDDRTPTIAYDYGFGSAWYPMPGRTFELGVSYSY